MKRVRLQWINAIPTNKRQPKSERTLKERSMAQEITEDGVHKDWNNNTQE